MPDAAAHDPTSRQPDRLPRLGPVSRITIYPVKSLDGIQLDSVSVSAACTLRHDRQYVLVSQDRKYLRAKETPGLHQIRATYDLGRSMIFLSTNADAKAKAFSLENDRPEIGRWLSDVLGQPVTFFRAGESGLPDDPNLHGPTIIGTKTLEHVAGWFDGIGVDEMRKRMRANIEIQTDEPFAEEALVTDKGSIVDFNIGPVVMQGVSICSRCDIPARDSTTGKQDNMFGRRFTQLRQEQPPRWAAPTQYKHYFRLSIRTRIADGQTGQRIKIGDPCTIDGTRPDPGSKTSHGHLLDRLAELIAQESAR